MDEKDIRDTLPEEGEPDCCLDEDQKNVILSDADRCLVIAGAGAGKTTTIAAKVHYLVEHKGVDPTHILVVSYSRKAVAELEEKIHDQYGVKDCVISTFHALGYKFIQDDTKGKVPAALNSTESGKWISEIFCNSVMKDKSLIKDIIFFFSYYFNAPDEDFFWEAANEDRRKLRGRLVNYKGKASQARDEITIRGEAVHSGQERQIANFLYLHGIPYEYEPEYPEDSPGKSTTPYRPDFLLKQDGKEVYFEHFGVSEKGENDSCDAKRLKAYLGQIEDKKKFHEEKGTKLIWTYSRYNDEKPLLTHLEQLLIENGFQFSPPPEGEKLDLLVERMRDQYERRMVGLITRFISDFKTNRGDWNKIKETYQNGTLNDRSKLFLKICHKCYVEYEKRLKEEGKIDFADMINHSVDILQDIKNGSRKLNANYEYIFVDEYQDISRQRFNFTKALSEVTNAKITAVGDDWQSIYAFSGSDITLFTNFEEKMGKAECLKLEYTYRNSQELIDVAGNFVQKNPKQLSKSLKSSKSVDSPVVIYTYKHDEEEEGDWKTKENNAFVQTVETVLEDLISEKQREGKEPGRILLLGRYNFDFNALQKSKRFYKKKNGKVKWEAHPELDLEFMTVHASKGLGYDEVILLNGKDGIYGFPSKMLKDPVLDLIPCEEESTDSEEETVDYPEERRLFYVALTRTKNRIYIIAPQNRPSQFLVDIKEDDREQEKSSGNRNVVLRGAGEWDMLSQGRKLDQCPLCGFPLVRRLKKNNPYGVDVYVCTNESEICDFITNDVHGDKLSITKCPDCGGFLIVKYSRQNGKKNYFLGCQNYERSGGGCQKTVSMEEFYKENGYPPPHEN